MSLGHKRGVDESNRNKRVGRVVQVNSRCWFFSLAGYRFHFENKVLIILTLHPIFSLPSSKSMSSIFLTPAMASSFLLVTVARPWGPGSFKSETGRHLPTSPTSRTVPGGYEESERRAIMALAISSGGRRMSLLRSKNARASG
jgi:hypothetical protein